MRTLKNVIIYFGSKQNNRAKRSLFEIKSSKSIFANVKQKYLLSKMSYFKINKKLTILLFIAIFANSDFVFSQELNEISWIQNSTKPKNSSKDSINAINIKMDSNFYKIVNFTDYSMIIDKTTNIEYQVFYENLSKHYALKRNDKVDKIEVFKSFAQNMDINCNEDSSALSHYSITYDFSYNTIISTIIGSNNSDSLLNYYLSYFIFTNIEDEIIFISTKFTINLSEKFNDSAFISAFLNNKKEYKIAAKNIE